MKWTKQPIKVEDIPKVKRLLENKVRQATPDLENIRCMFKYKDTILFNIYTAFDFINKYETLITQSEIIEFYLYQLVD